MVQRLPPVKHGKRLSEQEAQKASKQLVAMYNSGMSIRDLRDETGYSLGRLRRLLVEGGVSFRPRGGRISEYRNRKLAKAKTSK